MKAITCVNVSLDTKYVSLGFEIDGDICFVDVNLINNPRFWGVTVADWEGQLITKCTSPKTDSLKFKKRIEEDKEISFLLSKAENDISIFVTEE